jgi:hypothetical protein
MFDATRKRHHCVLNAMRTLVDGEILLEMFFALASGGGTIVTI